MTRKQQNQVTLFPFQVTMSPGTIFLSYFVNHKEFSLFCSKKLVIILSMLSEVVAFLSEV